MKGLKFVETLVVTFEKYVARVDKKKRQKDGENPQDEIIQDMRYLFYPNKETNDNDNDETNDNVVIKTAYFNCTAQKIINNTQIELALKLSKQQI